MVAAVNSHTNATSNWFRPWGIDSRFALNSTPGWLYHFQGDFCYLSLLVLRVRGVTEQLHSLLLTTLETTQGKILSQSPTDADSPGGSICVGVDLSHLFAHGVPPGWLPSAQSLTPDRCRVNMAHIRQSRPNSGLGNQVIVL